MALEAGTYVSDLVATNPTGTDPRRQGDDHIRLIKNVIQNTFPNLTGAVTATQSQLDTVTDATNFLPTGLIAMWSGTVAAVPSGWALCDGLAGRPNLVGRFIVGSATDAGGTYDIGDTGGSADIILSGSTDSHVLTEAQMPSHNHDWTSDATANGNAGTNAGFNTGGNSLVVADGGTIRNTGGGTGHSHTLSNTLSGVNVPPYYALAYIIKL